MLVNSSFKSIKKLPKILLYALVVLIRLTVFVYIVLHSSVVQTYLVGKIADYFSEKLNARVEVKKIGFIPFNSLYLSDLYIEDQHGDTLLFVNELEVLVDEFSFEEQRLVLETVRLNNVCGKMNSDTAGVFNFQFLLDEFASEERTDTIESTKWDIDVQQLVVDNLSFTFYKNELEQADSIGKSYGINFNDLRLDKTNFILSDIQIGDTLGAKIEHLSTSEKSGFVLRNLTAKALFSKTGIALNNLELLAGRTLIKTDSLGFGYKDYGDFSDFVSRVKIKTKIDSGLIHSADLAYFVPQLYGLNQSIVISGTFKGKVSRLKMRSVNILYGKNTLISGNFSIDGLPNFRQTFLHLDLKNFISTKQDIEKIKMPPFDQDNYVKLPDILNKLGTIHYKGNLTGFTSDFVTYGRFTSDLGSISTDLLLKQDTSNQKVILNGKLNAYGFNLGELVDSDSLVETITLTTTLDGSFYSSGRIETNLNGVVNNVRLLGYDYNNIEIKGLLTDKLFDGEVYVNDPNIKMDFLGKVDFSGKKPLLNFTADVNNANLYALNINTKDSLSILGFQLTSRLKGVDLDAIAGTLGLFNVEYTTSKGSFNSDQLFLEALNTDTGKEITVKSDFLDINLQGSYNSHTLVDLGEKLFFEFMPSFKPEDIVLVDQLDDKNSFNISLQLKEINPLLKIFLPELEIANGTSLNASLEASLSELIIHLNSGYIKYSDYAAQNLAASLKLKDRQFSFQSLSDSLNISSAFSLNQFEVNLEGYNDSLLYDMHWFNRDSTINSGDIASLITFKKSREGVLPSIKANLIPSEIILDDQVWQLEESEIVTDSSSIRILGFAISKEQLYINMYGTVSGREGDSLYVVFNQVNLENLNMLTRSSGITLGGILNGSGSLTNLYDNPTFYTQLDVADFAFNGDVLGDMIFYSNWNPKDENISLITRLKKGKIEPVVVAGTYKPEGQLMDFGINLDRLKLNLLSPYLDGILSSVSGRLNGDVELKGSLKKPVIDGNLFLQRAAFKVDYLNTSYNFTDEIHITSKEISFEDTKIWDQTGNYALASGTISHKNFSDINMDINLRTDQFLFLNTNEKLNSTYYGKAIASGLINLKGPPDNLVMDVSAKTGKGTKFFIPLDSGGEVDEFDFISFVDNEIGVSEEKEEKVDLSGMQMNFELEVTPDAEVQIIFDSKVGDIIRGRGNANLLMEINTLGKFNMYGDYIIESGDYLFTLQNVINKKFDVEKGGSIKWNGSPYEAYMDINAIYRLKAPLYDLMLGLSLDSTEFAKYRRRVPVECHLKMTETIMNPAMNFGIEVQFADDKAEGILNSLSAEEKNKQLISLLVLNRFYTPASMRGAAVVENTSPGAVGVTSSELLSNQLSHWLSQISNDFDIGVNYRPGDELSSDELEVALSTQLFNDRVSINGNVGVGDQNATGLVGDFDVNVKLNESGKLRLKAFTRSNDELIYENSPYTQGVGLFFREDFDSLKDLLKKYKFWESKKDAVQ